MNKGKFVLFEFNGRKMTLRQWATELGLPYSCVQQRFYHRRKLDAPKSRRGRPTQSAKEVRR